ncbi:MAG: DUF4125 family protein, partial [Spirochaetaceae bacterium]|nr:DUF4125 family protein [Spirochaetaceae bacterium]
MAADKHVNFFALQKACEKPECPLCTIINERIDRYIDGMLFEHISDRTFRAQYREAGGFCNTHAETLLSYRDDLIAAEKEGRNLLRDKYINMMSSTDPELYSRLKRELPEPG